MGQAILANELPGIKVQSAGVGALIGYPADPLATQLMADRGLDISNHRARQVTDVACRQADLILVMDLQQKRILETKYPFVRGKLFRFAESEKKDVPDPFKKSRTEFEDALALIEGGALTWIERIKKISAKEQQFI